VDTGAACPFGRSRDFVARRVTRRRLLSRLGLRVAANVVAEDDGFGNFFHRATLLAALTLNGQVRLLLIQSQVALQNSFRALDDFARLQLFGERRVGVLEAG
jgi:hypothetical protein